VPGDSFVGRSEELAALDQLLRDPAGRLVTLTGPPGIGKTRLAVAAVSRLVADSGREAVLVELADIRDPAAVVTALANALGVDGPGHADWHAGIEWPLVVVLDNFEHLLPAASALGSLLDECPELRVLVTSRERLRLTAEREFPVPPLAIPSPADVADLNAVATNPCVALLVDRARRVRPQFALTAANASAVVAACVSLDGIPLALELAATRLKALSPSELVNRLGGRMWLLQSPDRNVVTRHRALSAAIGWSYDLLEPAERELFERLSVFAGTWTIDDVAAACDLTTDEALVLVESLLDKSLIDRVGALDAARFRMLETLREYSAERLADRDATAAAMAGHTAYFASLAEGFEAAIGVSTERDLWGPVADHQPNLRAALERSLSAGPLDAVLPLAAAIGWYCYTRGAFAVGRQLLDRALATPVPDQAGDAYTGARLIAGILAWGGNELDRAAAQLEEALERSTVAGDIRRDAIASAFLGHVARAKGRYGEAARWHQRAELGYRRLDNPQGTAWVQYDLGLLARDRGDLGVAEQLLRKSLREFRDLDYPWAVSSVAWGLSVVLCDGGEVDEAAGLLGEALTSFRDLLDQRGVTQCLEALAFVACQRAGYVAAARLLGYASAQRRHLAAPLSEADQARTTAVEATLVQVLGPAAAERARQDGRRLDGGNAYQLGQSIANGQVPADSTVPANVLTRREAQVVLLVASGRTNRQIGTALGIAEKTAEVHVQHVMAKVGAHNRAEVAAWAVRQGLGDR
jgi:non-specific serine/threonine protein kinase